MFYVSGGFLRRILRTCIAACIIKGNPFNRSVRGVQAHCCLPLLLIGAADFGFLQKFTCATQIKLIKIQAVN